VKPRLDNQGNLVTEIIDGAEDRCHEASAHVSRLQKGGLLIFATVNRDQITFKNAQETRYHMIDPPVLQASSLRARPLS
jgi:hypothetical protein